VADCALSIWRHRPADGGVATNSDGDPFGAEAPFGSRAATFLLPVTRAFHKVEAAGASGPTAGSSSRAEDAAGAVVKPAAAAAAATVVATAATRVLLSSREPLCPRASLLPQSRSSGGWSGKEAGAGIVGYVEVNRQGGPSLLASFDF